MPPSSLMATPISASNASLQEQEKEVPVRTPCTPGASTGMEAHGLSHGLQCKELSSQFRWAFQSSPPLCRLTWWVLGSLGSNPGSGWTFKLFGCPRSSTALTKCRGWEMAKECHLSHPILSHPSPPTSPSESLLSSAASPPTSHSALQ